MKEDTKELKRKLKNLRETNKLLRTQIQYLEQLNTELADKYRNVNERMMYLKELQNSKNQPWGRIKSPGEVITLGQKGKHYGEPKMTPDIFTIPDVQPPPRKIVKDDETT